ncbi:MAG: hypothetical protein LBK99_06565 [Opitutaceae bacterium]|nr:hypothetical protein [Opitutaceae bacterium]
MFFGYTVGVEAERHRKIASASAPRDLDADFRLADGGGVFFEVVREIGMEFVAQRPAVKREEIERLVPVAEPPFAIGRLEPKTVPLDEIERGRIGRVLAGGQGDGEVMLAAIDKHRRGGRPGGSGGVSGEGGGGEGRTLHGRPVAAAAAGYPVCRDVLADSAQV